MALTSRYSAATLVVSPVASLFSVQSCSNCEANESWPVLSSCANAACVGPKYLRKNATTSFGLNGYSKFKVCRSTVNFEIFLERRCRTAASSPQSTGGTTPGGGGTIFAVS